MNESRSTDNNDTEIPPQKTEEHTEPGNLWKHGMIVRYQLVVNHGNPSARGLSQAAERRNLTSESIAVGPSPGHELRHPSETQRKY